MLVAELVEMTSNLGHDFTERLNGDTFCSRKSLDCEVKTQPASLDLSNLNFLCSNPFFFLSLETV